MAKSLNEVPVYFLLLINVVIEDDRVSESQTRAVSGSKFAKISWNVTSVSNEVKCV